MALIERYILRNVAGAFVACLVALTLVIWITEALKQLDLLTGKGQTILVFFMVTGLSLPALVVVIAPVALFIATIYALNKLNGDSELIVMSAAGVPPLRLLKPFLVMTIIVSALLGWLTIWLMPDSFQGLRDLITKIRADFVANVVKPGQFTTLDSGITFHYRERSGDALLGIFMQDRHDPGKATVYIAERGQAKDVNGQSYLVLEKGTIQREEANSRDSAIVSFDRYAIDLSAFGPGDGKVVYKPRERSTEDLLNPDTKDAYYQLQKGRFRAELHDRFSAPLYPLAMMLIAFAALGQARTTRQGRGAAVATAIVAVVATRIVGFAASSAAVRTAYAVPAMYGTPLLASLLSLLIIVQGPRAARLEALLREKVLALADLILPARFKGA